MPKSEDKYSNFEELALNEREGRDYRIVIKNRMAQATVIAIHGGKIESTTSEIAKAIAGTTFNIYLFEGMKSRNNSSLHITSHRFDEPRALSLVRKSPVCISIHGCGEKKRPIVYLGGLNRSLKGMVLNELLSTGLIDQECLKDVNKFPASLRRNIVNRGSKKGVQIEISRYLRDSLKDDREKLKSFSSAIRRALHLFLNLDQIAKRNHLG
jgi:phage replication-related protein YjqB (UPF0714/DUF867 family)